jgi:hypothetical protein
MGSRLEAMREAHGPDVGLLDEILGFRAVPGEIDGEVVKRVEVLESLLSKALVDHGRGR